MTATALLKQAQTDHTSGNLGTTEEITYNQTGQVSEVLLCFVSSREINFKDKDTRVIEQVFSSILLAIINPKQGDTVLYDSDTYTVMRLEKQMGRYILYTERERHHTSKRKRHTLD